MEASSYSHSAFACPTEKTDLLRLAKTEAEREVTQYRASLEEQYQQVMNQGSADAGAALERLTSDTSKSISEMSSRIGQKKSEVRRRLHTFPLSSTCPPPHTMTLILALLCLSPQICNMLLDNVKSV